MDSERTVVILGRNYSTSLGVARALGVAGYTVEVVLHSKYNSDAKKLSTSKYIQKVAMVQAKKSWEMQDMVLFHLREYAGREEKPVLFMTDDFSVALADANRKELEQIFLMPATLNPEYTLSQLMEKNVQNRIAKEAGLATPLEWTVDISGEIVIPEDMVYPCFVKPLASNGGYKIEMKACGDEEELREHLEWMKGRNPRRSVLVQEFLNITTEYSMSGVCLDGEIILPAIVRKTAIAKQERGVTLAGKLVPLESLGETGDKIINMLKAYRYQGMFDMEINDCGGVHYFGEVNLRPGGPNFSYFMSGTNLPDALVRYLYGEPRLPEEEVLDQYGKTFVNEKVAWEDYFGSKMNRTELDEELTKADFGLITWDEDPGPGEAFARSVDSKLRRHRREINRIKRSKAGQAVRAVKDSRKKVTLKSIAKIMEIRNENSAKAIEQYTGGKSKGRVLVVARNYSSILSVARDLYKAGFTVDAMRVYQKYPKLSKIDAQIKPEMYSKCIREYSRCVVKHDPQRLLYALKQQYRPNEKTVIVPVDDLVVQICDEYYDELKDMFILQNVGGQGGGCNRWMEKALQKELAVQCGLKVVGNHALVAENTHFTLPEGISYPCFIKPNISMQSSKSIMRRCDSEEELTAAIVKISTLKHVSLMIEDFIEIEKEYALLGICDGDNILIPDGFLAYDCGHGARTGVAVEGEVISTDILGDQLEKIKTFLRSINFYGLFDIDLIGSKGEIYFCEINMRYGASGYAIGESGARLPGIYANHVLNGKPLPKEIKLKRMGATFVSERILMNEYRERYLKASDVSRLMKNSDIHLIYDEIDFMPYWHFRQFYAYCFGYPLYKEAKKTVGKTARKTARKALRLLPGRRRRRKTSVEALPEETTLTEELLNEEGITMEDLLPENPKNEEEDE